MPDERYTRAKDHAREIFTTNPLVHCPYFDSQITLNSDGFHHLQFSSRHERSKAEQLLKFSLLPLALKVIRKSGTIQEYRKTFASLGKPSARDSMAPLKQVEYWGLVAIIGDGKPLRIRVVLRRIGDGKLIFWSVMPAMKLSRDAAEMRQRLANRGLEDE